MTWVSKNWKGIALCLLISLPSWLLVSFIPVLEVVGAPVIAIIAGMLITLILKDKSNLKSGIAFTSKAILQCAVVLLGFGLNLATIAKVGSTSLPIIISTIATALILSFILCKLLKIPSKIATLVGVGSSICGGSAIAATAPVIDADDEEIAQSISVIFLFNVLAALIFPTFGGMIGLSNEGFGLFAGTAVNDTSSVTAAASTWDTIHSTGGSVLETATIVKLTRTLAIIPITLVLAFIRINKEKKAQRTGGTKINFRKIFPMFILYFVLASVITTLVNTFCSGAVLDGASTLFQWLKTLSKFFIVMAMAAIGLNTNIVKLIKTGGKPILQGFCCWVAITGVSLLAQHLLSIW
ncbi:MAG: YeiH family putative sulfate export transporter [Ruminococcus sp.]|nr:YeiH family putative sulfate export transporter [Ruminococcus sp.]